MGVPPVGIGRMEDAGGLAQFDGMPGGAHRGPDRVRIGGSGDADGPGDQVRLDGPDADHVAHPLADGPHG